MKDQALKRLEDLSPWGLKETFLGILFLIAALLNYFHWIFGSLFFLYLIISLIIKGEEKTLSIIFIVFIILNIYLPIIGTVILAILGLIFLIWKY